MLRRPVRHLPHGFTLIELLVVVAVLSAASLLAFGVFSEDRTQIRYDDTRQRLQILRRAILGHNGPATGEASAGFVADNGAPPADLVTLLQVGALQARAARSPIFDPKPDDTTCANDGSADDITLVATSPATAPNVFAPAAQLVKGHGGDYLGGLAVNGRFRDGWGNVSSTDDAVNFGWNTVFDSAAKTLTITSLGLDNVSGGSDFGSDFGLTVATNDWLIPISGWTVQVKNRTNADINANSEGLSVSLLVYANTAGGDKWYRYATATLPCLDAAYGTSSDGQCINNSNVTVAGSSTVSAAFHDGCKPGVTVPGQGRIPQGRHLLVLSRNGLTGNPWTTDDKVTWTISPAVSSPILSQIDAIAGRNLPAVTLEIR
ncbi:MAG: type II secretion system protein [Pseudomonadota bacterium]